jgi:hypothetical protein
MAKPTTQVAVSSTTEAAPEPCQVGEPTRDASVDERSGQPLANECRQRQRTEGTCRLLCCEVVLALEQRGEPDDDANENESDSRIGEDEVTQSANAEDRREALEEAPF